MKHETGPIYNSKKDGRVYVVVRRPFGFYRVMSYSLRLPYLMEDWAVKAGPLRSHKAAAVRDLQRIAYQDQQLDKRPLTRLTGISCGTCCHYDAQTWTCMQDGASGLPPFHHCANWRQSQERGERP